MLQMLDVQITYAACLERWLILSSLHEADGVECLPTVPGREVRPMEMLLFGVYVESSSQWSPAKLNKR